MKVLLQKLGYFFLILLLIKLSFVIFYEDVFIYKEPELTEPERMSRLVEFIEAQLDYRKSKITEQEFDTVFIGSSRTSYSIIPAYFDTLTRKQTKSYNFGINAGFPPMTFNWCEDLIRTKQSLKYIFFELSEREEKISNADEFRQDFAFPKKVNYLESYLNNLIITSIKPGLTATKRKVVHRDYNDDYNIPLQKVFEKKAASPNEIVSLQKIQLSNVRNRQVEKKTYSNADSLNKDYWDQISKLIALAESKQIHIYFFIPPRLSTEHELKVIYPIYQKLERKYKLTVTHYDDSLYQINTSFDDFHLNDKGATKFTELLAEAFDNHVP